MKKQGWPLLIVLLCLLLTACKSANVRVWNDAPAVPEELVFQVSSICDLEDADGKTLHCGSPSDFYGTIDGKAGYMTGESPAYFSFTVPYSEYYRFHTESKCPSIFAMSGLFTELELYSPAEQIEWRLSGWRVKSDGTGATLRFNVDSRERYVAVLDLQLNKEAELSMGLRHIGMSGLSAEAKMTIWDFEKMMKSAELTIPTGNGAATIVFDELENDQIEVITGGETESRPLEWNKIG